MHTQPKSGRVVKVKWVYLEAKTLVNNTNYYCSCIMGTDIARMNV